MDFSNTSNEQFKPPNVNIAPLIEPSSPVPENPPEVRDDSFAFATPESKFHQTSRLINQRYQLFLDKISPHWKARWTFSIVALLVFMARVVLSQGWYVICYGLAIYYLNLLIGFLSPKVDPSLLGDDDESGGPMLPTHANDEYRPFIRRLPEFKFWIGGTSATLIALFLTLFEIFDLPVFWPILLIYFLVLFACTMRQQIKQMIKYSYVPWDSGKRKYASKPNDESATSSYTATV